ncbi:amino acid ABC transporter permease [Oceanobacillus chungangensis]|uniref:Amino acid ABC transporter permease n=2 Tax=Oceanobacillus chungangensis TaxID=1229152 RepID=A0A3D8PIF6_9BACI|nr:amino acid ABC transporter permease [Oceanobacillus chungangensis]
MEGTPNISGKKKMSDNIKSSIFLSPALILLLIFFLTPMLLTIVFSFTNLALTGSQAQNLKFVGFENFIQMFNDAELYNSIGKTLIFVLFSAIIGQCFLGFLIAFLMKGKNATFRRAIGIAVIAAWVTPEIVVGFSWVAFLGDNGTMNSIITALSGIEPIAFLFEYPMVSVVVANIWRGTAFSMMAFQAALDDIPLEVEEAAVMDGASRWRIVRNITIPIVKGTITTNLMLVTLQTLGVFTLIYAMTGGGPGNATMTLPVYMYKQAFVSYQLGYGTAISLVILIIGALFSLLYMRFLKVKI